MVVTYDGGWGPPFPFYWVSFWWMIPMPEENPQPSACYWIVPGTDMEV